MPNVPIYSSSTVAPTALPGVRQQTPYRQMQAAELGPAALTNLGKAMTNAGGEAAREITLDQIQTNEAAAKEYDAKHMSAIQAVLAGSDDDPSTGYLNQKGKNAVDTFDTTVNKIKALTADLDSTLANPAQQELVKNMAAMRTTSALAQVKSHQMQQADVYEDSASQTRTKVAQDGAALSFNPLTDKPGEAFDHDKPEANTAYQQYLATIRSEATARAAKKFGVGDDTADLRAAFVKDELSTAYVNTLGHMIDAKGGKPADMKLAQSYFDSVKGELSVTQQDKIRSVLEAGTIKNDALALAIDIGAKGGSINAQEKELNALFKENKINADVHGLALQHLRADNAQRRSEQSESDKSILGTVWDMARKGGKLTDLTPSQLSYVKQRGLGTNVDAIFKQAEPGGAAGPDDSRLFNDLMRMSADNPSAFISQDLALVSGQLSQAHWNHLVGVQTSINRQDVKAMESNKLVHSAINDTRSSLLAAGFDLTPKEGSQKAKDLEQFESNVRDQLIAAQPGWVERKLNPAQIREETRKITLGALKEQSLSNTGFIWNTKLPVWKMTPEQRAASWDIPDADKTRIKAQLSAGGLPASEANIQQYYKLEKGVTK